MDNLEKEYRSGPCRVRINSFYAAENLSPRTGEVIVLYDERHNCWKIQVETKCSDRPVYSARLRDELSKVSLNSGKRLHLTLHKNNAKIIADLLTYDSQGVNRFKALESVLNKIKSAVILPRSGGKSESKPARTPPPRSHFEASEVLEMVSSESSDEAVLFDEPSRVFTHDQTRRMSLSAEKRRVPSRSAEILARSRRVNSERAMMVDKENRSEQERASSFYSGTIASDQAGRDSPLVSAVRSLNSNVRLTPKKSVLYSMRKPGLLPTPSPNSGRTSTGPKQTTILPFSSPQKGGFSNLGNTCYLNATLQTLLGLAPFNWDLVHNTKRYSLLNEDGLYLSLLRLHRAKRKNLSNVKDQLARVKQAVESSNKRFSGFDQHDAQEFLAQVLDQLNEETQQQAKTDDSDHDWINPVVPNFQVEVEHSIKCEKCDAIVTTNEHLYILSVEVPKTLSDGSPGSIQSALDNFFSDEKIEYKCEKCGHDQSTVHHEITTVPRIVIVHLKRWYYDHTTQSHSKIAKPVFVPTYVTMTKACTEKTTRAKTPANPSLTRLLAQNKDDVTKDSDDVTKAKVEPRSSSPLPELDRSDGSGTAEASMDNDLQIALAMSRRQYEEDNRRRRSSTPDEERQVKHALAMSLMELQPTIEQGYLPYLDTWTTDKELQTVSTVPTPPYSPLKQSLDVPDSYKTPPSGGTWSSSSDPDSDAVPKSVLSDLETGQVEIDDSHPFSMKRHHDPTSSLPSKSRRREYDLESGMITTVTDSFEHGSDTIKSPASLAQSTGLKGGWPLDIYQYKNDSGDKKCDKCSKKPAECTCERAADPANPADLANPAHTTKPADTAQPADPASGHRPSSASKAPSEAYDCLCDFYGDPKKCMSCMRKTLQSRSSQKPWRRVYSPSGMKKPGRVLEKKFQRTDESNLAWIVDHAEKMNKQKQVELAEEAMDESAQDEDSFQAELEKAKKLSLQVTSQQTEDELLEQVIQQSMLDQGSRDQDDGIQRALEASRLDDQTQSAMVDLVNGVTAEKSPDGGEKEASRSVRQQLLFGLGKGEMMETDRARGDEQTKENDKGSKDTGEMPQKTERFETPNIVRKVFSSDDDEEFTRTLQQGDIPRKMEEELVSNEVGKVEYSYGLVSVISHIGSSAFVGHYIADVYEPTKGWRKYDDTTVTKTSLSAVREESGRRGYVFCYMAREVAREVDALSKHPLLRTDGTSTPAERSKLNERSPNIRRTSPNNSFTNKFDSNRK